MEFMPASSSARFPTATDTVPPNKVPIAGTIPRCVHGVYIGSGESRAQYCQQCSPDGPSFRTRDVVLPRSSGDPLDHAGLYANNKSPRVCPNCGSTIYLRQKETGRDTQRECADCGKQYRVKQSFGEMVKAAEADLCLG